ncbi:MAG: HAMP domain-containing sensor histidine kinase [Candidatus Bathyarchaeia archaeon]
MFCYYIFAINFVFVVSSAIVFERSILSPLKRLSMEVTNIAKKGEISARINMKGNDEVSAVAAEINNMLESIEHMQQEINESTKQLEQAKLERLAIVGQAATMVGHDLRNPLMSIIGATYLLRQRLEGKLDKKSIETLEIIEKSVKYADKIVNELLDYSKVMLLKLEETTPKLILQETLSEIEIPKSVQLINLTQDNPKIKVDSEKMKRVFANIIKNAIEAMPNGGKITVNSKEKDQNVEFEFSDSGIGMAADIVENVGKPFFTTKAKGIGLGVAISKRIVEAHGGKIAKESKEGKGTTVQITLPITR